MSDNRDFAERMQIIREWAKHGRVLGLMRPSPADLAPLTNLNRLRDRLADIRSRQTITEQPFTSRVPLLAPLIVWVRSAWNWVSTKWYVILLIEQQNDFNGRVVSAWTEMLDYLGHVITFSRDVYTRFDYLESRLDEMANAQTIIRDPSSEPTPVDLGGLLEAAAPSWRRRFDLGPVTVLSCGQGEAVRILADQGLETYGVESSSDVVEQDGESSVSIVHADDVEHLASVAEGTLGGILAVWQAPMSVQHVVRLLVQCQRTMRTGAWAVWIWPWPATHDETDVQMARSIALGMGFRHVGLETDQRLDVAFQTLSLQK